VGRNRAGLRLVTNRAANLMTRCDKGCSNCAAYEAVRAGDEDLHSELVTRGSPSLGAMSCREQSQQSSRLFYDLVGAREHGRRYV
jgi:hypothetical protein